MRCACHGGLFDLESGVALAGPTDEPLRLFPTRVVGGRLEADVVEQPARQASAPSGLRGKGHHVAVDDDKAVSLE